MVFYINSEEYIDTDHPLDISIQMTPEPNGLNAWGQPDPKITPVRDANFIGSIKEGGVVNFNNISFNPHAHITHTECCGHITEEFFSVNDTLKSYFFECQLITIDTAAGDDNMIRLEQLQGIPILEGVKALVIRTTPNNKEKLCANYSMTDPAFLESKIATYLIEKGIDHLLVDLPSVDQEKDGGELAFHHAFWNVPENPNVLRTITEFVFISDEISDGKYILEIQMCPLQNDAAPSRPVLYERITK